MRLDLGTTYCTAPEVSQTMDNAGRNSSSHLSNNAPPPPDTSTEVRQNNIYLFHCETHALKAVRNQLLKKKAAESMCDEMKLKGDIILNTNNDEVVGLSRPE